MKYQITITIPDYSKWVEDAAELKQLLEKESNLWTVTNCDNEIAVVALEDNP